MKILIVSDSHGRNTYLEKVIRAVEPIDLFIHLGDMEGGEQYLKTAVKCPIEMVSGNNDYFTKVSREKIIQIGKYKVFLTHGHRYRVNFELDTIMRIGRENAVDIVMFGHTHIPVILYGENITAVNPGSISQPRQPGRIPSYMIMEIDRFGEAHFTINYVK